MAVDSFKYLPRSFRGEYEHVTNPPDDAEWAPLSVPMEDATIALITSAGLYLKDSQEPFNLDRERQEPMWGDPSYRVIPNDVRQSQVGASHLHLNTNMFDIDLNVALPIRALAQLASSGRIGAPAAEHYSFMGYQSRDLTEWRDRYGPDVVKRLGEAHVDAVVLAPA